MIPSFGVIPQLALDRKTLEAAFIAAYCAQRKGETDKLLEVYKKYGFEDPKAWTKAWNAAAADHEFVARVTQAATTQCP